MRNLGLLNIWQYSFFAFLLSVILLLFGISWMGISFSFGEWISNTHPHLRSAHVFFGMFADPVYYKVIIMVSAIISVIISFSILLAVSITKTRLDPLIPSA